MNESATPLKMRGESAVTLCGEEYKLRATFRALVGIEERCKADLMTLMTDIGRTKISIAVIASMFYELHRAAGGTLSPVQAGELLMKSGITEAMKPIMELLASSLTSGDAAKPTDPS